jgi:putative transposase
MKGVLDRFKRYHNRRSIRLKGYDYSRSGAYFITLNIHPHAQLILGNIVWATGDSPQTGSPYPTGESPQTEGPRQSNFPRMELNEFGQFVREEWERSFEIRRELQIDVYQIMPDHFHAIVIIRDQSKDSQDKETEDKKKLLEPGDGDTPVAGTILIKHVSNPLSANEGREGSNSVVRTNVVQQIPGHSDSGLELVGNGSGIRTNLNEINPLGLNSVVTDEPCESLDAWTGTEDLIGANDSLWILNRPKGAKPQSIGALIAGFKASTIKRINAARNTPGKRVWQRDYYERIIRNERAMYFIRRYIKNNPLK